MAFCTSRHQWAGQRICAVSLVRWGKHCLVLQEQQLKALQLQVRVDLTAPQIQWLLLRWGSPSPTRCARTRTDKTQARHPPSPPSLGFSVCFWGRRIAPQPAISDMLSSRQEPCCSTAATASSTSCSFWLKHPHLAGASRNKSRLQLCLHLGTCSRSGEGNQHKEAESCYPWRLHYHLLNVFQAFHSPVWPPPTQIQGAVDATAESTDCSTPAGEDKGSNTPTTLLFASGHELPLSHPQ